MVAVGVDSQLVNFTRSSACHFWKYKPSDNNEDGTGTCKTMEMMR